MDETVIFPLSEDTGQRMLAALLRIAAALEGGSGQQSSVDGTTLTTGGTVDGRTLTTDSGAGVSGRTLSL